MKLDVALALLGLDEGQEHDREAIEAAYRAAIRMSHPDRYAANEQLKAHAEEQMKRINEAHEVLVRGTWERGGGRSGAKEGPGASPRSGRQEDSGFNVGQALDQARDYLKQGEWNHAIGCCEQVLKHSPREAEAYFYELMALTHTHNREELGECEQPLEDFDEYDKVMEYGSEELCAELGNANERSCQGRFYYQQGLWELPTRSSIYESADKYLKAAEYFEKAGKYRDAPERARQCKRKALEQADLDANKLSSFSLKSAIGTYERLGDFEDAREHLDVARKRLATVEAKERRANIATHIGCAGALLAAVIAFFVIGHVISSTSDADVPSKTSAAASSTASSADTSGAGRVFTSDEAGFSAAFPGRNDPDSQSSDEDASEEGYGTVRMYDFMGDGESGFTDVLVADSEAMAQDFLARYDAMNDEDRKAFLGQYIDSSFNIGQLELGEEGYQISYEELQGHPCARTVARMVYDAGGGSTRSYYAYGLFVLSDRGIYSVTGLRQTQEDAQAALDSFALL